MRIILARIWCVYTNWFLLDFIGKLVGESAASFARVLFGCFITLYWSTVYHNMSTKPSKEHLLLRWLDDEKISVEPISAAKSGEKVYAGVFGDFKWAGKYYEAEVLKISGEYSLW